MIVVICNSTFSSSVFQIHYSANMRVDVLCVCHGTCEYVLYTIYDQSLVVTGDPTENNREDAGRVLPKTLLIDITELTAYRILIREEMSRPVGLPITLCTFFLHVDVLFRYNMVEKLEPNVRVQITTTYKDYPYAV